MLEMYDLRTDHFLLTKLYLQVITVSCHDHQRRIRIKFKFPSFRIPSIPTYIGAF